MNFFEQLAKLLVGMDITITVRGGSEQLTVSVLPKPTKDKIETVLVPLVFTGTPQEIDYAFFGTINKPLQEAAGAVANIINFEQSIADTNKIIADKKAKTIKEKKDKEDAKLEKSKTQKDLGLTTKEYNAHQKAKEIANVKSEDDEEDEDEEDAKEPEPTVEESAELEVALEDAQGSLF